MKTRNPISFDSLLLFLKHVKMLPSKHAIKIPSYPIGERDMDTFIPCH